MPSFDRSDQIGMWTNLRHPAPPEKSIYKSDAIVPFEISRRIF